MKKLLAGLVLLLLAVSLPADERTYIYLLGGQRTGKETTKATLEEATMVVVTERKFIAAAGHRTDAKTVLYLDTSGRFLSLRVTGTLSSFEIESELTADPDSGRVTGTVKYLGERAADIVAPPGIVVMDSTMWSLEQLLKRFDANGGPIQQVEYFEPTFFGLRMAKIELIDEQIVENDGEEVAVLHYLAAIGNAGMHLYSDKNGQLLQASIPLGAVIIVLDGWQGKIDIKLPEPDLEGETLYEEEEVKFSANDVSISGAVTIPRSDDDRHPAVVLISGSGPQDRNEDTPLPGPYGLKSGIFRTVAHHLSNAGFLVLRYNDYGVPPSGGFFQTHTLSDRVNVARGAVRYLQSRRDVNKRRIGLIGHSEGGIIAPIVAVEDPEIKAIVLMAGTGRPIDRVVMEQSFALSDGVAEYTSALPILMEGWREVRSGKDWGRFRGLDGQFLGWFRSHVQHDPYETMKGVRCKVAILNGALDLQVLPGNAFNLALALEEGGNTDYSVKIFPELDHLFMKNGSGGSTCEYADFRRRLDRGFLQFLETWLKDNL